MILYGIGGELYGMVLERHGMVLVLRRHCMVLGKCIGDAVRSECAPRPQTQRLIYAQVPPFTMIHRVTSFTLSFTSTQLAVNARLEVNVPRLELEFGRPRGLFPMQILIAWDFHKSEAWYVPACAGTHASLCCGGLKVQSGVMVLVPERVVWEDSMRCAGATPWCPKHEGRI